MFKIFSKFKKTSHSSKIPYLTAIILCAGNSTRFGSSDDNKQLTILNGKSVAERTIEAFNNNKIVKEIVLVVRKEDIELFKELISLNCYKKVKAIVTGGASRQISALRGLKHVSDKTKYVAIHDGARCLITDEMIEKVVKEAIKCGAATAAFPVVDTIKLSDKNGYIKATLDRNFIWHVQTPQVFEYELYKTCSDKAKVSGKAVTDDCMLIETYGSKVKLVNTGEENLKITVLEDIKKAEFILKQRENMA